MARRFLLHGEGAPYDIFYPGSEVDPVAALEEALSQASTRHPTPAATREPTPAPTREPTPPREQPSFEPPAPKRPKKEIRRPKKKEKEGGAERKEPTPEPRSQQIGYRIAAYARSKTPRPPGRVCAANYAFVEVNGRFGLIDEGADNLGNHIMLAHATQGRQIDIKAGEELQLINTRNNGESTVKVMFTSRSRYYPPGKPVSTVRIGVRQA